MKSLRNSLEIDSGSLNFCFWRKESQTHCSGIAYTVLHLWTITEYCKNVAWAPSYAVRKLWSFIIHLSGQFWRPERAKLNSTDCCNVKEIFLGAYSFIKQLTLKPHGFLCHRRHHNQTGPAVRKSREYFRWYKTSYRIFQKPCKI